ncbi:MAG: hypothetical protein AAB336_08535 [Acidobacteriota bacterium]
MDYPVEKAHYLSPEQSMVAGKVDVRTDVYALGAILYEMLAGETPLNAPTTTDLLLKHLQEMPPPITAYREDLPIEVDDILLKALAKNPEIRFQTVNEFADELNQVSLSAKETEGADTIFIPATSTVFPTNTATPIEQPPQNNIWKTAFIVLAGMVLLGGSFIYLTSGKQTNPSTTNQFDANGMPVQPVNPATGTTEQGLANMNDFNPNIYSNMNTGMPDGGGTNNPYWDQGTRPPGAPPVTSAGGYPPMGGNAPYPVMPSNSGPTVYVDPNNPNSIFMPVENSNRYVMVPANTSNSNVNTTQKNNSNSPVNSNLASVNTNKPPSATPTPKTTPPKTTSPTPSKETKVKTPTTDNEKNLELKKDIDSN